MTEKIILEENTKYSKKQIQKAGELLLDETIGQDSSEYNQSMEVLSYWRSAHAPALESVTNLLTRECSKHDASALIAKRLKRTPSIISKLRRYDEMKLRNMQDIGGCRAVLKNQKNLQRVYRELNKGGEIKHKNYIKEPKSDGYRGIHIIYPVPTSSTQFKIEIQLRTRSQHAWATAVEIVDLFTNQNLKSDNGRDEWKEFFKAASVEIENLENGIPPSPGENLKTFITLLRKMKVKERFESFSSLVDKIESPDTSYSGEYNLLSLTTKSKHIKITPFKPHQFIEATNEYLKLEKKTRKSPSDIVALISVSSLHNLKEAYPNYFADSKHFIELVQSAERYGDYFYPNSFLYRALAMAGFGKVGSIKELDLTPRPRKI